MLATMVPSLVGARSGKKFSGNMCDTGADIIYKF